MANLQLGDVNFDGIVNGLDIADVASHWLQTNPQHLGAGDGNGDGIVNGLDIALIASHWLQTTPPLGGGWRERSGRARACDLCPRRARRTRVAGVSMWFVPTT